MPRDTAAYEPDYRNDEAAAWEVHQQAKDTMATLQAALAELLAREEDAPVWLPDRYLRGVIAELQEIEGRFLVPDVDDLRAGRV